MKRIKSTLAVAVTALALTATAHANIGGTDPRPPMKPPTMDVSGTIQIAMAMFGL